MEMPIHISLGWSRDGLSPLSLAIRYFSRPGMKPGLAEWSHMFLVFTFANGREEIHEALGSQGWCRKDAEKLARWAAERPRYRAFEVHRLPLAGFAVAEMYRESNRWLGHRSYAVKQIAAFAVAKSLLGRYLGLSIGSGPGEVICSEGACQIVGEIAGDWDLRPDRSQSWDSVTPQDAYDVALCKLCGFVCIRPRHSLGGLD